MTQTNTLTNAKKNPRTSNSLFARVLATSPILPTAMLVASAAVASTLPADEHVEAAHLAPMDACTMAVEVDAEGTNYGWIIDLEAMDPAQLTRTDQTLRISFDERRADAMTGYVAECGELSDCVQLRMALSPALDDGTPVHLVGPQTETLLVSLESGNKTTSDLAPMLERRAAKCGA